MSVFDAHRPTRPIRPGLAIRDDRTLLLGVHE